MQTETRLRGDASQRPTPPRRPRHDTGNWVVDFFSSAVGMKWVMGLTGVMLIGFVIFHYLGNLKVYIGPEEFDHYAEWLRDLLVPFLPRTVFLWILRIGLIVAFVAHIGASIRLTRLNQVSTAKYQTQRHYVAVNFASRSMRWTGTIVLLFLIFHLADLTWGVEPAASDEFVRGDVYNNFVATFDRVWVGIIYIVANIALGIHLFHGAWSMFQTMGLNNPQWNAIRRPTAIAIGASVIIVNCSFPIAVWTGVIEQV